MKLCSDEVAYERYLRAFHRTAHAYADNPDQLKKLIFYGIKAVIVQPMVEYTNREEAGDDFDFAETINSMIGTLTPGEFVNLFPITKDYDGHRYGFKDYFYTRDYIKSLLLDKPIGDNDSVFDFLWEYYNPEITQFLVRIVWYIESLRRLDGRPSLVEGLVAEYWAKPRTLFTDDNGKRFVLDGETGKTFGVKERRPRYLKVL